MHTMALIFFLEIRVCTMKSAPNSGLASAFLTFLAEGHSPVGHGVMDQLSQPQKTF